MLQMARNLLQPNLGTNHRQHHTLLLDVLLLILLMKLDSIEEGYWP